MPASGNIAARAGALWKRLSAHVSLPEWLVLLAVGALFIGVHASQIAPVFGESDGARMATDAAGWHFEGKVHLETTDYRMRTSPLYIHGLKTALDLGLRVKSLPRFMAWVSLISSLVGLVAAYFLFRPLIGRTGAAVATLLLMVAPAYWLSGAYGMSHGPGLTAWLLALCTFSVALSEERSVRSFLWISGAAALLVFLALSLKADLVLNGLAFPGLVLARRRLTRRTFAVASAIVVVGLLLQMVYIRAVVTPLPAGQSTAQFATAFNQRFPFELRAMGVGLACITNAPGRVLFVVGLVAALQQLLGRRGFRLALFALGWGLPIVLFWGFIIGNSARHNLSALPPLMLMVGAFVVSVTDTPVRAAAFAALLAAANYFSDREGETAGFGTVAPRSDVLALMPAINAKSEEAQAWARGFGRLPGPKKALVARWSLPFAVFDVLRTSEGAKQVHFDGKDILVTQPDGTKLEVRTAYAVTPVQGNAAVRALREEGFTVWRRDF